MERLFYNFLFFLALGVSSCSKDSDCGCDSMVGEKYAWSVKRDKISDGITLDDFKLRKDGKIDIWRFTSSSYIFMENMGTYEIKKEKGNCMLKTSMVSNYKPVNTDPKLFPVLFGISTDGQWTPIIINNCDSFSSGSMIATRQ